MDDTQKQQYQATLDIKITSVKLEDQNILDPQALTIINDDKEQFDIPFKQPIKYKFESVEQQMVFKFAILGKGDLLGFLYIEIPERYKKIKNFTIDDWFPIKQVETEDSLDVKLENFLARVIIKYRANKKMTFQDKVDNLIEEKVGYQKIAKNLKRRMVEIYRDVDNFEQKNKDFLKNFEKKMLTKRQKMRKTKSQNSYRPLKNGQNFINKQKTNFYQTKDKLGQTQDIKQFQIRIESLYPFYDKTIPDNQKGYLQHKKLILELSQAKQEIIQLKQTIQQMKDGQLTVDNKKYKQALEEKGREIEEKQKQNFYLQNENKQILEDKQNKLESKFARQYQNLEKEISSYKKQIKELETSKQKFLIEQEELTNEKLKFEELKKKFEKKLQQSIKKERQFQKEKQDFKDVQIEFEEIKQRLMDERQQVMKQANIVNNKTQDYDLQKIEIKNKQQILEQQISSFNNEQKIIHNQNMDLQDQLRRKEIDLKYQEDQFIIEKKQFMQEHGDIIKEKTMLKNEGIKIWNERFELQEQQKKYQMWKQQVEEVVQQQLQQLEEDFVYIEFQLEKIEKNKKEFDFLKNNLEQFQRFLIDQQNIQNNQMQQFYQLQDQFFLKVNKGISQDELEDFQEKFKIKYDKQIKDRKEQMQLFQEIEQQKKLFLKHINKITMEVENEQINQQRKNTEIRKKNTIGRQLMHRNQTLGNFEKEIKIKIDAEKIANIILEKACQNYHLNDNVFTIEKKPTYNVNLTNFDTEEVNVFMIKSKLYKFIEQKKYKLDKENYQLFRSHQLEEFLQDIVKDLVFSLDQLQKNNIQAIVDTKDKYDDEQSSNKIRKKFEQKIKLLVEYIEQLKKNSNFFNNDIDSKILVGKKGSFIHKQQTQVVQQYQLNKKSTIIFFLVIFQIMQTMLFLLNIQVYIKILQALKSFDFVCKFFFLQNFIPLFFLLNFVQSRQDLIYVGSLKLSILNAIDYKTNKIFTVFKRVQFIKQRFKKFKDSCYKIFLNFMLNEFFLQKLFYKIPLTLIIFLNIVFSQCGQSDQFSQIFKTQFYVCQRNTKRKYILRLVRRSQKRIVIFFWSICWHKTQTIKISFFVYRKYIYYLQVSKSNSSYPLWSHVIVYISFIMQKLQIFCYLNIVMNSLENTLCFEVISI